MNQCQQLHETIVRDILDVMDNVKDFDQVEWIRRKNNVGSIAKRASNLVLVFPVICSTSISIQTASIITKAIERKCVSLLQILFSSMQLTSVDNMYDYLSQFHTNLDRKVTLDDFITAMDKLVDEGAVQITDMEAYQAVKEDMKNINYYLSTEINPTSINDYVIRKNIYGESHIIKEASAILQEAPFDKPEYIAKDHESRKDRLEREELDAIRNEVRDAESRRINNRYKDIHMKNKELSNEVDYFRNQLSTGERQRVAIARAIVNNCL